MMPRLLTGCLLLALIMAADLNANKLGTVAPLPSDLPGILKPVTHQDPLETVKSFETSNGYKIYLLKKNKAAKITISIIYGVGTSHDALKTRIIEKMLLKGAGDYTQQDFARRMRMLGASFDVVAGSHFTTLMLTVPNSNLGPALKIANDLLFHPALSQGALEDTLKDLLVIAKAQQYSTSYLAAMQLQRLLFGDDHSWVTQWFGHELFEQQTVKNIRRYYQDNYIKKPLAVSVLGDVPQAELKRLFEQNLSQWAVKPTLFSAVALDLPFKSYAQHGKQIHLIDVPKSQQVDVRVGMVTVSMFHKDWPALFVLADILGGSGGRLYNDLREMRGLTYGVYSRQSKNQNKEGYFEIYGSTQTHKLNEFMQGILMHWQGLASSLSDEELRRSKSTLLGRYRIGRYKTDFIKDNLNDDIKTAVGLDVNQRLYASIDALSLETVRHVAQKYANKQMYWVVAGDGQGIRKRIKTSFNDYKVIAYDRTLKF